MQARVDTLDQHIEALQREVAEASLSAVAVADRGATGQAQGEGEGEGHVGIGRARSYTSRSAVAVDASEAQHGGASSPISKLGDLSFPPMSPSRDRAVGAVGVVGEEGDGAIVDKPLVTRSLLLSPGSAFWRKEKGPGGGLAGGADGGSVASTGPLQVLATSIESLNSVCDEAKQPGGADRRLTDAGLVSEDLLEDSEDHSTPRGAESANRADSSSSSSSSTRGSSSRDTGSHPEDPPTKSTSAPHHPSIMSATQPEAPVDFTPPTPDGDVDSKHPESPSVDAPNNRSNRAVVSLFKGPGGPITGPSLAHLFGSGAGPGLGSRVIQGPPIVALAPAPVVLAERNHGSDAATASVVDGKDHIADLVLPPNGPTKEAAATPNAGGTVLSTAGLQEPCVRPVMSAISIRSSTAGFQVSQALPDLSDSFDESSDHSSDDDSDDDSSESRADSQSLVSPLTIISDVAGAAAELPTRVAVGHATSSVHATSHPEDPQVIEETASPKAGVGGGETAAAAVAEDLSSLPSTPMRRGLGGGSGFVLFGSPSLGTVSGTACSHCLRRMPEDEVCAHELICDLRTHGCRYADKHIDAFTCRGLLD